MRREVLQLMSDLAEDRILIVVTHEPELFEGGDAIAMLCWTDS